MRAGKIKLAVVAKNQEQRSELASGVETRSPVKTCTLARPEAPVQSQRDAHSKLPFADLRLTNEATLKSPEKAPFSTHAHWSDVGCTIRAMMRAGGTRTAKTE